MNVFPFATNHGFLLFYIITLIFIKRFIFLPFQISQIPHIQTFLINNYPLQIFMNSHKFITSMRLNGVNILKTSISNNMISLLTRVPQHKNEKQCRYKNSTCCCYNNCFHNRLIRRRSWFRRRRWLGIRNIWCWGSRWKLKWINCFDILSIGLTKTLW